ncbi:MAG TPA: DUF397 domain-containing protein [Streptosporangiaceae bacterium]|nr:DUF397 domain-containing protein [Streptosporangiaceae bacterium]
MANSELSWAAWRKSSYSGATGSCVEVARQTWAAAVAVRDSKDPTGPVLAFGPEQWADFMARVKGGTLG